MEYDPQDDIRSHYRQQIKRINAKLDAMPKRDPRRHALYAERKDLGVRLRAFAASHSEPVGALADYGVW